jgi:hypothetical protein
VSELPSPYIARWLGLEYLSRPAWIATRLHVIYETMHSDMENSRWMNRGVTSHDAKGSWLCHQHSTSSRVDQGSVSISTMVRKVVLKVNWEMQRGASGCHKSSEDETQETALLASGYRCSETWSMGHCRRLLVRLVFGYHHI